MFATAEWWTRRQPLIEIFFFGNLEFANVSRQHHVYDTYLTFIQRFPVEVGLKHSTPLARKIIDRIAKENGSFLFSLKIFFSFSVSDYSHLFFRDRFFFDVDALIGFFHTVKLLLVCVNAKVYCACCITCSERFV